MSLADLIYILISIKYQYLHKYVANEYGLLHFTTREICAKIDPSIYALFWYMNLSD